MVKMHCGNPCGQLFGPHNIECVSQIADYVYPNGEHRARGRFVCPYDGVVFDAMFQSVNSGHTVSCGCVQIMNYKKPVAFGDARPIPNFPNYYATFQGHVLRKVNEKYYRMSTRTITNKAGLLYEEIGVTKNKRVQRLVHRLVASAWIGPIPKGWHVHHKDTEPLNNRADNLVVVHPADHRQIHEDMEKGLSWQDLLNTNRVPTAARQMPSQSTPMTQATASVVKPRLRVNLVKCRSGQKKKSQTQLGLFSKEAFRL